MLLLRRKQRLLLSVMAVSVFFAVQHNVSTLRRVLSSSTTDFYALGQSASAPNLNNAPIRRLLKDFIKLGDDHADEDASPGASDKEAQYSQSAHGAFIHMGKTGGSTLSSMLKNGCHSFIKKPCRNVPNETVVSKLIESYYHVPDFGNLPDKNHSFYLVSLRDPFDRIKSAFAANHPANDVARGKALTKVNYAGRSAAFKCFPSLEVFTELLGDDAADYDYPYPPNQLKTENCTNFARACLHAKVRRLHHFYFNYEKIQSLLPAYSNPTIYATRKEHLTHDWKQINAILGQHDEAVIPEQVVSRNVTGLDLPTTRDLSENGRKRLCRALQKEYDNYIRFLWEAENLSDEDVEEALEYSREKCPEVNFLSKENALLGKRPQ